MLHLPPPLNDRPTEIGRRKPVPAAQARPAGPPRAPRENALNRGESLSRARARVPRLPSVGSRLSFARGDRTRNRRTACAPCVLRYASCHVASRRVAASACVRVHLPRVRRRPPEEIEVRTSPSPARDHGRGGDRRRQVTHQAARLHAEAARLQQ